MIALLLLACNPYADLTDRWSATWDACEPEAIVGEPDPYALDATLSAPCQDALLDDFHVDRTSLAQVPATDDHPSLEACFLTSAYALLTRDAGGLANTAPGDGVYDIYLDELQEVIGQVGGESHRQLTYNYAAGFTAAVTAEALDSGVLAYTDADGLHLAADATDECGVELAHLLFHESGHARLDGHIPCPEGFTLTDCPDCADVAPSVCDAGETGTFALEASLLAVWAKACDPEVEAETCGYLEEMGAAVRGRVGVQAKNRHR